MSDSRGIQISLLVFFYIYTLGILVVHGDYRSREYKDQAHWLTDATVVPGAPIMLCSGTTLPTTRRRSVSQISLLEDLDAIK